ncbi:4-deoxy-4-formamido-L-arabinose-phosphoundecaprenol deformylase [Desulfonatronum sp. SC1]|uniref:4-deoxy-4-formamido-L-arabinose- phosphoundecaprenol deformylase n=1 Tax=Desulfonatronum sp. SC1 TaxID=2109626 RepID=UPI000D320F84|nr:4-deoxy-4-formamido-L-arabinose-phosphoundecaprenol deformylase [Desulfonatronum sp. SC1]PTN31613.1 4-deoxy-4-formamido-L-arabinose-phosphoundecaprenol deformylase [Desulfonatronum sp. SC1]
MIPVGLRVDVDTLRGTRVGVPNLLRCLERHDIRATFFFSVGPDNMGRHLWRLARPGFLAKMLRTGAPSLYGWDILLRGTLWPGPVIGKACPEPMRMAARSEHEVGLHAWDHHHWQTHVSRMDEAAVTRDTQRGVEMLAEITGKAPACAAAPAWRTTPVALKAREKFGFRFAADCRGHVPFRPVVAGEDLLHVQIPTTLPTYDELIGHACSRQGYNAFLLEMIRPDQCNVLTIHAEAEGIACLDLFEDFLEKARHRGIVFSALGDFLPKTENPPRFEIIQGLVQGREGWLARQAPGKEE